MTVLIKLYDQLVDGYHWASGLILLTVQESVNMVPHVKPLPNHSINCFDVDNSILNV